MFSNNSNARQLLFLMARPTFLILDLMGFLFFGLTIVFPSVWSPTLQTAGSTFLTMGLTLPIALYYQNIFNYTSFQLLKACDKSGIKAIFVSRQLDNHELQSAIEKAAQLTAKEIFLSGVCFRTLFDPNVAHTSHTLDRLSSPQTMLRVLILDPESEAAHRRAKIEFGGATLDDIKATINRGIVSTIQTRMSNLIEHNQGFGALVSSYHTATNDEKKKLLDKIEGLLNIYIHTYSTDPTIFIMGFSESMFVEQYHFGRIEGIVPFGGCIGKYVPVIQYESASIGFKFFKIHFEYMWQEYSTDITRRVIDAAICSFPVSRTSSHS